MVNLTLEACVRYPLYTVIYCKQVHYTTDSLVWGLLRLTPIRGWASGREWGECWGGWAAGDSLYPPLGLFRLVMHPRSASHKPKYA